MGSRNSKYSDFELLTLLKQDDQDAFKCIYEDHHQRVYQVADRYLRSESLAQEVVQDVFLKLWMIRKDCSKILSIEAWIYTVTRNNILNRLKKAAIEYKAKEYLTKQSAVNEEIVYDHLMDKEYAHILKEVLSQLPPQQKKVFELARQEKMSYAEIANELQLSPLTVKTHMARALQEIRKNMAAHGIEIPMVLFLLKNFF